MQILCGTVWGQDLQGCSEETQGKLCSLDLFLWCHSAFGVSGALNEPKSVCAWSDGHLGPRGGQPLNCQQVPSVASVWEYADFFYMRCLNSQMQKSLRLCFIVKGKLLYLGGWEGVIRGAELKEMRFPILLYERYFSTKLLLPKPCPLSDCKQPGVPGRRGKAPCGHIHTIHSVHTILG